MIGQTAASSHVTLGMRGRKRNQPPKPPVVGHFSGEPGLASSQFFSSSTRSGTEPLGTSGRRSSTDRMLFLSATQQWQSTDGRRSRMVQRFQTVV